MNGHDQFHVGIVVDDVEATLHRLTELLGYEWCQEIGGPIPVVLPSGEVTIDLRSVYSKTVPRLEIVQSVPGTVWMPADGSGIHHLGYWSDDIAADQRRLQEQGFSVEALGVRPGGAVFWGYYRRADGPRIELVSRVVKESLEQVWSSA